MRLATAGGIEGRGIQSHPAGVVHLHNGGVERLALGVTQIDAVGHSRGDHNDPSVARFSRRDRGGPMNDPVMTPAEEHEFYGRPENQVPQGPPRRRMEPMTDPVPVRFPPDVLEQVRAAAKRRMFRRPRGSGGAPRG